MSVRVDRTKYQGDRPRIIVKSCSPDDVNVALNLTAEEIDALVATLDADAATVRRSTWRRRTSIRTSIYRPTKRKPNGCRL